MSETQLICPACGHAFAPGAAHPPIELNADGLPLACAIRNDLGVPLLHGDVLRAVHPLSVWCDGSLVRRCVGYSIPRCIAWHYRTDALGDAVIVDGDIPIDSVEGVITIARTPDGGPA